jgi:sulfur relay (sulfurtransferase) DsrC/TusE family protein
MDGNRVKLGERYIEMGINKLNVFRYIRILWIERNIYRMMRFLVKENANRYSCYQFRYNLHLTEIQTEAPATGFHPYLLFMNRIN